MDINFKNAVVSVDWELPGVGLEVEGKSEGGQRVTNFHLWDK